MGETNNEIWINKDIETVFQLTNQIERWKDLFSEYSESSVLNREGNRVRFRLTTYPDENQRVKSWVSERIINKDSYTCEATRLEPKIPFKYMFIFWEYKERNNGTFMRWVQKFEVHEESKMTEEQLEDYINKNSKVQMQVIKEKIESGIFC